MAITRKFQEFRSALKNLQTTQIWIVKVEGGGKINGALKDAKLEFKADSIDGCPPASEEELVEIDVGGFHFTYQGKVTKNGEVSVHAFEDVDGKVGKLYRAIKRLYYKSGASASSANAAENVASALLKPSDRFKVTIILADNTGKPTRQWVFHDCIPKAEQEGALGQEGEPMKYNFTFVYSMYAEDNGEGGDSW